MWYLIKKEDGSVESRDASTQYKDGDLRFTTPPEDFTWIWDDRDWDTLNEELTNPIGTTAAGDWSDTVITEGA